MTRLPPWPKKRALLASVTEQFKVLAQPGLAFWLEKKLAEAAYNYPPRDNESLDTFFRRIKAQRYKDTSGAASLGSEIHGGIEHCLEGGSLDELTADLRKYVEPAVHYFREKKFVAEHLEKIVVCLEHTFAGTADVIGTTSQGQPFIMDWKSKNLHQANP